jgi:ABC-type nitrate/sulfonate/bicarbonate transport system permease component
MFLRKVRSLPILPLYFLAIVICIWEMLPRIGLVNPLIIPPFTEVIRVFFNVLITDEIMGLKFTPHLLTTLSEFAYACALMLPLGFSIGFCVGQLKYFGMIFEPIIYLLYAIPNLVLYPIFLLILGIGELSKIVFGIFVGIFPCTIYIISGFRQVDKSYIRVARLFGAKGYQLIRYVIIPAAMPGILLGIRLGICYAFIGVILAETLGSLRGLGYLINTATYLFNQRALFVVISIILIISTCLHYSLQTLEKMMLRWQMT